MIAEAIQPTLVRRDDRGEFYELTARGTWRTIIYGQMNAGAVLGQHYHKKTNIHFQLISGRAQVTLVDVETQERDSLILEPQNGVLLETMVSNAIHFVEPSTFVMLKDVRFDPEYPDTYPYPVDAP